MEGTCQPKRVAVVHEFSSLADVRVRAARLSIATAATAAGLRLDRLRAIENGATPTVFELERLGQAYGVDADTLGDEPIRFTADDGVMLLASLDEFAEVTDITRARILQAANAARDLTSVRRLLGDDLTPQHLSVRRDLPYEEGAMLAEQLRQTLKLGVEPLRSVRDLIVEHFPWIGILYARLGSIRAPAGVCFADSRRGSTIVLNLDGKNTNARVRRFSLAHELCHILADAEVGTPLATISGFLTDTQLAREQRANGFAVRLLCPETVVQRLRNYREEDAARVLIEEYGLSYAAARLYLKNEAQLQLPQAIPQELEPFVEPSAAWADAELPRGVNDFPLLTVPVERRGLLAHAASRAYATGLLARDEFARLLGLTPAAAVESVLGYFELDAPEELSAFKLGS